MANPTMFGICGGEITLDSLQDDVDAAAAKGFNHDFAFTRHTVQGLINKIRELEIGTHVVTTAEEVADEALGLLHQAHLFDHVIVIDTVSNLPLASGNTSQVVRVQPRRINSEYKDTPAVVRSIHYQSDGSVLIGYDKE